MGKWVEVGDEREAGGELEGDSLGLYQALGKGGEP